jgi:hypothetical protein
MPSLDQTHQGVDLVLEDILATHCDFLSISQPTVLVFVGDSAILCAPRCRTVWLYETSAAEWFGAVPRFYPKAVA